MQKEKKPYYLELDRHPVRFDPVSAVNNVFFDEANTQIFAVRSGGETGVVVKGPDVRSNVTFRLQDKGQPIISIKFSYQHRILAVQRTENIIGKNNKILTFHWISSDEIVLVTSLGLEYYNVISEKRIVKLLKHYNLSINWSIFSPESAVLLCSTTPTYSVLVPFHFKNCQVFKLPKFDTNGANKDTHMDLQERDVTLINLYGNLYAAILRHPVVSSSISNKSAHLNLYLLSRETPAKRKYVLDIGLIGRFAINILDSLIIIHHQLSKVSMLFDIKISSTSNDGYIHVKPIVVPFSIRPSKLVSDDFSVDKNDDQESEAVCELYTPTWIVFQPNIIIDAALGCMWFLRLKLKVIATLFDDTPVLIDFLLLRSVSKAVLLKVIKQMTMSTESPVSLQTIALVFNKLNKVYKEFRDAEEAYLLSRKPDSESPSSNSEPPPLYPSHRLQVVLDISDMYTNILSHLAEHTGINQNYVCSILMEYVRSLHMFNLPIKHYLEELLLTTLMKNSNYFQVEQLLQNNILTGSKQLAAKLVKMGHTKPSYYDFAMEMFKKLQSCNDEVIDTLLLQGKVMSGLRYVINNGMQDSVSARKFLEAATKLNNTTIFYHTYKFFETRNLRMRGKKDFKPGELCEEYVVQFKHNFPES